MEPKSDSPWVGLRAKAVSVLGEALAGAAREQTLKVTPGSAATGRVWPP